MINEFSCYLSVCIISQSDPYQTPDETTKAEGTIVFILLLFPGLSKGHKMLINLIDFSFIESVVELRLICLYVHKHNALIIVITEHTPFIVHSLNA